MDALEPMTVLHTQEVAGSSPAAPTITRTFASPYRSNWITQSSATSALNTRIIKGSEVTDTSIRDETDRLGCSKNLAPRGMSDAILGAALSRIKVIRLGDQPDRRFLLDVFWIF